MYLKTSGGAGRKGLLYISGAGGLIQMFGESARAVSSGFRAFFEDFADVASFLAAGLFVLPLTPLMLPGLCRISG